MDVWIGDTLVPWLKVVRSEGAPADPRPIVPEPITLTVKLNREETAEMQRFLGLPPVVNCRKCAARRAGQRPTTRSHHRDCPMRGNPLRSAPATA